MIVRNCGGVPTPSGAGTPPQSFSAWAGLYSRKTSSLENHVVHSQLSEHPDFLSKIKHDFFHQIVIVRLLLHGLRGSAHVHQNVWHLK